MKNSIEYFFNHNYNRKNGVEDELFLNQQCESVTEPGIEPETFQLLDGCFAIWAIFVWLPDQQINVWTFSFINIDIFEKQCIVKFQDKVIYLSI